MGVSVARDADVLPPSSYFLFLSDHSILRPPCHPSVYFAVEITVPEPSSRRHRIDCIDQAQSVVVKVGTRVLTNESGQLDLQRVRHLAGGLCQIADTGRQVIMVSSGAVGAGMGKLGMTQRPIEIGRLQAVAAIGQTALIQAYEQCIARHGRQVAQVLLTRNDLRRRGGYLHVRNALSSIHELGAIAVVNENDSVAVAELMTTFGDNDRLAAQVSGLFTQALMVILSDIDGLYDGAPEDPSSSKIDLVESLNDDVTAWAQDHRGTLSKGGMTSKLQAAQLAVSCGHHVVIGPGKDDQVLQKILAGQSVGTLFLPAERSLKGRKRWIGGSAEVEGRLMVDPGAVKALKQGGSSLLAIGIRSVKGDFKAGAVVAVCDESGNEIARGLSNYPASEIQQIKGKISDMIGGILGHCPYESVVHRNNLTLNL